MSSSITSTNEQEFVRAAAKEDKRVDGRGLFDHRKVRVSLGTTPGIAEVQLGTTRVLACVTSSVAAPLPGRSAEGTLTVDVTASPMADIKFEASRPPEEMREVRAALVNCFQRSRAVDLEALCLVPGRHVIALRVDIRVLDHGGSVLDCASLAGAAALMHFRRPDVTVAGETPVFHPPDERPPVPLTLHTIPLCVSFGLFSFAADDAPPKQVVIVDPTRVEERVIQGKIVVTASSEDPPCLYGLSNRGGVPVPPVLLQRCAQMAVDRAAELGQVLAAAIDAHKKAQPRPGRRPACAVSAGGPSAAAAEPAAAAAAAAAQPSAKKKSKPGR